MQFSLAGRIKMRLEKFKKGGFLNFAFFILYFSVCTLVIPPIFGDSCLAVETATIKSNSLDYDGRTSVYTAKGEVKVEKGNVKVEADEITYNEGTSEVSAEGNVLYEDPRVVIRAKNAEM